MNTITEIANFHAVNGPEATIKRFYPECPRRNERVFVVRGICQEKKYRSCDGCFYREYERMVNKRSGKHGIRK